MHRSNSFQQSSPSAQQVLRHQQFTQQELNYGFSPSLPQSRNALVSHSPVPQFIKHQQHAQPVRSPLIQQVHQPQWIQNQQQQQQQQRYSSPAHKVTLNSSISLSASQVSNTSTKSASGGHILESNAVVMTAPSPVNSKCFASASKKAEQELESQQSRTAVAEEDQQIIQKLRADLVMSKALCANTQQHNDQLVQKIKVLIKENELMHDKLKVDSSIEPIKAQSEAKNNQASSAVVTRGLESKIKLLILENERLTFLLKQAQIIKSSSQDTDIAVKLTEKTIELESISLENASLHRKIKELNLENEKLKVISNETFVIPEQQVSQIEEKFAVILEENQRISDLLVEKNAEVEELKLRVKQLEVHLEEKNLVKQDVVVVALECETFETASSEKDSQQQDTSSTNGKTEVTVAAIYERLQQYERVLLSENQQLREKTDELSKLTKQSLNQQLLIAEFEQQLKQKTELINILHSKLSQNAKAILIHQAEVTSLRQQLSDKECLIAKNCSVIASLEIKMQSIQEYNKSLEEYISKLNGIVEQQASTNQLQANELNEIRAELSSQLVVNEAINSDQIFNNQRTTELKELLIEDSSGSNSDKVETTEIKQRELLERLMSLEKQLIEQMMTETAKSKSSQQLLIPS